MKFKTKPVEIDAIQYTGHNVVEVWAFTHNDDGTDYFNYGYDKSEGKYENWAEIYDILHKTWIKVFPGNWIIRGTKGEYYPCDDETFKWKYDQVDA